MCFGQSFSVHHQESSTIGIKREQSSFLIPLASSQQNLYNIYLLLCVRVQCWTPDDVQRDCPKHVEFRSRNKFAKLLHLVGFVIRIYFNCIVLFISYLSRLLLPLSTCPLYSILYDVINLISLENRKYKPIKYTFFKLLKVMPVRKTLFLKMGPRFGNM